MSIFLALLAAADDVSLYAGPRPEPTAVYLDWITGCDNERNCSAVALAVGEGAGSPDHLEILIEKPLGYHLEPVISVRIPAVEVEQEGLALFVDAAPISLPLRANGRFRIEGPAARALLNRLRAGRWAILRDAAGGEIARTSLAGVTAVLMRIDEQQGRTGTPRALAWRGERRPHDDLPGYRVTVGRPAPSDRPPAAPDAAAMAGLVAGYGCDAERTRAPIMFRLDAANSMMIAQWPCGSGAYNLYSSVYVIDDAGTIRPAEFDFDNGITGDGPGNLQVNVTWDAGKRVLESFARHRGIGDCGRVDRYIWDGARFRLSEQLVMPECRMAFDRIRIWKIDVVER